MEIKIFFGSSIVDLELERYKLMSFVQALNNKYQEKGIFFRSYICEETSSVMMEKGSQYIHDEFIRDSDITIFMFYHKAGEFTMHELELARSAFLKQGKPNVYVFFKLIDKQIDSSEEIRRCVDIVFNGFGHYYKVFEDIDTVKLELLQCLVEIMPERQELVITDGKVYLGKEKVDEISIDKVFAYQNNPKLKELKGKIDSLLKEQLEKSKNGDLDGLLSLSVEVSDLRKEYNELEKEILKTLTYFTKENNKGKKANPRRMEALRLLEYGKIDEAKALISFDEITSRVEVINSKEKVVSDYLNNEKEELVEDAKVRIQALSNDVGNDKRYQEIEDTYDSVYDIAKSIKDYEFLDDYYNYVLLTNNLYKAIKIGKELEYIYSDPNNKDCLDDWILVLAGLGRVYTDLNDFSNAKRAYDKIIDLNVDIDNEYVLVAYQNLVAYYQKLKKFDEAEEILKKAITKIEEINDDGDCDYLLALTNNNFVTLYLLTGQNEEAIKYGKRAVEILRKIVDDGYSDEIDRGLLGTALGNIGLAYRNMLLLNEAKKYIEEGISIYEKLIEEGNRASYEPELALLSMNIGLIYSELSEFDNAREYILKATNIYERLSNEIDETAYKEQLGIAHNNLLLLYQNLQMHEEAKKEGEIAKGIFYYLVNNVSKESYEPNYGLILGNLGNIYGFLSEYDKALDSLKEGIKIYEELAKGGKEAYIVQLYQMYNSLGLINMYYGLLDEAKHYFDLALNKFLDLAKDGNEYYELIIATIYNNLALLSDYKECYEEVIKYGNLAVDLYRKITEEPNGKECYYEEANTLSNLCCSCYNYHKYSDSIIYGEESLKIFRMLCENVSEDAYELYMARLLWQLTLSYFWAGDSTTGLARLKESLELYGKVVKKSKVKDVYKSELQNIYNGFKKSKHSSYVLTMIIKEGLLDLIDIK